MPNLSEKKVDNSIAAIMTMMLPGLGQLMKGQIMPGIFWALIVGFGYFSFFWPGLIFHIFCIMDAAFSHGESWIGIDTWYKKMAYILLVLALLAYIVYRNF
ncbi:MAG: hypothetical protein AB7I27_07145 [Bacteriovoracaceae bacterium]